MEITHQTSGLIQSVKYVFLCAAWKSPVTEQRRCWEASCSIHMVLKTKQINPTKPI